MKDENSKNGLIAERMLLNQTRAKETTVLNGSLQKPYLQQLYYRGVIKSCNYTCSYCPFSKHKHSQREQDQDKKALWDFTAFLCSGGAGQEAVSVLITPYGEALIHDYYWDALTKLTQSPYIKAAGCQTNASFPGSMIERFLALGGNPEKLRLWCSFHPEMTSAKAFADRCAQLHSCHIPFCTGAVGDPGALAAIQLLHRSLPPEIYLWINRMDGLPHPYSSVQIRAFQQIDPYFFLEATQKKAVSQQCSGGKTSLFVEADGSCYACNISGRKLGNLYDGSFHSKTSASKTSEKPPRLCTAKSCSCYLAYCNRTDLPELCSFLPAPAFRIPHFIHKETPSYPGSAPPPRHT